MHSYDPKDMKELENPAFVAYLETLGLPIRPDGIDFDKTVLPASAEEAAHQYRSAQASKIMRLYREWKTTQNQEDTK
jgi:hypothetical protein